MMISDLEVRGTQLEETQSSLMAMKANVKEEFETLAEALGLTHDEQLSEMQIFVKTSTGKTITLEVSPNEAAEVMLWKLQKKKGLRVVTSDGKELEPGRDLTHYNIQKFATLTEVGTLDGFGKRGAARQDRDDEGERKQQRGRMNKDELIEECKTNLVQLLSQFADTTDAELIQIGTFLENAANLTIDNVLAITDPRDMEKAQVVSTTNGNNSFKFDALSKCFFKQAYAAINRSARRLNHAEAALTKVLAMLAEHLATCPIKSCSSLGRGS